MTNQQQMKALLEKAGIPAKQIKCYGSQVMITCWGREAAEQFHILMHKFCANVRAPWEALDDNIENRNTVMNPTKHKVWRVWGTV